MADRHLLDLFAGQLGWAMAFLAKGWKVTAVDLVRPAVIPDGVMFFPTNVMDWTADDLRKFDFVCASPPCEQFSVHLWGNAVPPLLPKGLIKMGNQGGWRRPDKTMNHDGKHKRIPAAVSATIPSELSNCVAEYAERIVETQGRRIVELSRAQGSQE
jgi:hypothetical protein